MKTREGQSSSNVLKVNTNKNLQTSPYFYYLVFVVIILIARLLHTSHNGFMFSYELGHQNTLTGLASLSQLTAFVHPFFFLDL